MAQKLFKLIGVVEASVQKQEVKEVRTTSEEKKRQYYIIYGLLDENPRLFPSAISKVIKKGPKTVRNRMNEAFDEDYISKPKIRKKSYLPFKEHVYFAHCKDPLGLHLKFSDSIRYLTQSNCCTPSNIVRFIF